MHSYIPLDSVWLGLKIFKKKHPRRVNPELAYLCQGSKEDLHSENLWSWLQGFQGLCLGLPLKCKCHLSVVTQSADRWHFKESGTRRVISTALFPPPRIFLGLSQNLSWPSEWVWRIYNSEASQIMESRTKLPGMDLGQISYIPICPFSFPFNLLFGEQLFHGSSWPVEHGQ